MTSISLSISSANSASASFHSLFRLPLLPPQSQVTTILSAYQKFSLPTVYHQRRMLSTENRPVSACSQVYKCSIVIQDVYPIRSNFPKLRDKEIMVGHHARLF